MTFADPFSPSQIQLLREAAENKHGMMALVIPFPSEFDENSTNTDRRSISLPGPGPDQHSPACAVALAEKFLRLRRQREEIFPPGLFADPSWDMLLDLFIARAKATRPMSISSLCIAAAVPQTTALRWIDHLVRRGLLRKDPDPNDGRRTFVGLADEGWQKMHTLLTAWAEKI